MKALGVPLRRPIATGACYLALLVIGGAALDNLPVSLAPDLELPRLTVALSWSNATPFEMESLVTAAVEAEAQTLARVEEVRSTSSTGAGMVDVSFERGTDMDLAEVHLRERLAAIRDELPDGLAPPAIERTLPRGVEGGNFLVLQATGPYSAEALRKTLEEIVLPRLLAVPGVAGAQIYGGSTPEIRLDADRRAVERGLVRVSALGNALDRIGGTRPLGSIVEGNHRVPFVLERPEAEPQVVAAQYVPSDGPPLRISDVAHVTGGWAEPKRLSRLNGQPSIQLVLEREPGTNVVRVAGDSLEELDALAPRLPDGVGIEVLHDQSERIREELNVLIKRAAISVACIFGVLVLFHRRVRAPIAVIGSVVFSALATFILFRAAGLGMNLVTLSGLALAFGMAVDNAIVILENITLRARGKPNLLRTLAATREVLFPLLAATLTTAVVLVPFLYMSGDLRDFYLPFVLAVCLSLTASMGIALTLTPLLSRWTFAPRQRHVERVRSLFVRFAPAPSKATGTTLATTYGAIVDRITHRPWVPAVIAAALFAGSLWVFDDKVDRGSIFPPNTDTRLYVSIEFPPGGEIAQANALITSFEDYALAHEFYKEGFIEQIESQVFERQAGISIRFHPATARSTVPDILRDEMVARAAAVSGVSIAVQGQGPGYSSGGANVSPAYQLVLRGPDYLTLEALTESLGERLKRNGRIKNIDTNLSGLTIPGAVQLALIPDRNRLAETGVSMRELVDAVEPAIAGETATRSLLTRDGEIEARVRYGDGDALTPPTLQRTLLNTDSTAPFELGEVLAIEEQPIQPSIRRHNQQYERVIGFEYRGPRKIGNRFVEAMVENTALPPGYSMEEGLGAFLTGDEERQTMLALWMALLFVYMITAALFESLILPFVALLSVPLSFVGIAAIFWATGEPFDRTAYVGLILLAGIAINNALLFVHRAGSLKHRLGDAREAARRAAQERIRPILMTTATSVAGLVPLAWSVDSNAVAGWRSLALAGTGGLLASALFTLTIIPALFVLLSRTPKGVRPMRMTSLVKATGHAALALAAMALLAPNVATALTPEEIFEADVTVEKASKSGGYAVEPVLTIGGPDADEPAQFYEKLGTIEVDADAAGNVYVLDNGNQRVQVFDARGNYVRSMGQEGEGPGEFKMPTMISVNAGGQVAVFDMIQQRISIFDASGKLLRDQIVEGQVEEVLLADDGGLLLSYEDGRPALGEKLNAKGETEWRYGIAVAPEEQNQMRMKISLGGVAPRLALAGDTVVHASDDLYCVRVVSAGGEVGKSFTRPFDRQAFELPKPKEGEDGPKMVMVTKEHTGGPGGGVKTDVSVGDAGDHKEMTFDAGRLKDFMPEFAPDIRGVVAWPDGRIWIATASEGDDTIALDEWTTAAELVRSFELSGDYDALRVGRDGVLYAVGHDEDDFPIVWRLDVQEKVEG